MRLPKIKRIVRAVVVSLACCLVVVLTACSASDRFNAEAWQRSDGSDPKDMTRCQMVDDLMTNYLHTGISREEVFKLIGEPTDAPVVQRLIGVCGFGVDYEYLELTFDEAGKLKEVRRIQG
jgi:hypothetical protein